MAKIYVTVICLLLGSLNCFAQTNADDTIPSPVRTMSYKQYKGYMDGVDIDHLALVAELNHYPDPQKVLAWKTELALTPEQLAKITAINTESIRKKKEMGRLIVKNERVLDSLFRYKKLDDGTLIFYSERTDLFRGELRNAILQTYLKLDGILTPEQKKKYQKLLKL